MSNESIELLPCPLCGGPMSVRTNRDWHRLVGDHADNCLMQDFEPYYAATPKDREALVTAWNRRAPAAVEVTDDLAMAFHRATSDGSIGQEDVETIKAGLSAVFIAAAEIGRTQEAAHG